MYFISLYLNDYVFQNQGFGFQFQTLCHVATPTMFWYDPLIHAWQGVGVWGGGGGVWCGEGVWGGGVWGVWGVGVGCVGGGGGGGGQHILHSAEPQLHV